MSMSKASDVAATNASTSSFFTALVFHAAFFAFQLGAFTLVRPYFRAIYQPRTLKWAVKRTRCATKMPDNFFSWPWIVFNANYHEIRSKTGMDAYFFVRFLRMMVRVLVPIWLVSWAILLPATGVRSDPGTLTGLDRFTFGNVPPNQQSRYAAHIILAWVFTIWIGWNIRYEMKHYVTTRQKWLIEPENASSAMASTVLITGVPRHYLTEAALTKLFSHLPGGVGKVWLNRDLKDMPDIYERRLAAAKKLESAETDLVNTAVKLQNKEKAGKNNRRMSVIDAEQGRVTPAEQLVPRNKRPSHRLPAASWMPFSLPLMGKKVDTIKWARQELTDTNQLLHEARRQLARDVTTTSNLPEANTNHPDALKADPGSAQKYPPLNSAFILFNNQIAAHMAAQMLTHHMPYRMATKTIGVSPKDVVWSNLNMNPYEARIRTAISWAITISMVVACAIPVTFVGAISDIHSLCATYKWLAWLCRLPPFVTNIISGILSPALLTLLNLLLPIILRLLARFEGKIQQTMIELSLMSRFFLFQVVNSFLVVTLSPGIVASLSKLIHNPASILSLLAKNLPKTSNFFLTYIILQGLSGTGAGFLQIVSLVSYYVKLFILGSTPRSIFTLKYALRSAAWGTLYPSITVLVVITFAYSIISPIINGLSAVTFFLFYQMYKYLFIWQLDGQKDSETGGIFFPRAIQHVFIGMYLQQICLAALFFLAQDDKGKASGVTEGALMIVLILLTIFFHLIINNSYGPLKHYLPLTLADSTFQVWTNPNATAAAHELDDGVSYRDAENAERRNARMRIGPTHSLDSQSSGAATRAQTMEVSTVEETTMPSSPSDSFEQNEEDTPNSITLVNEDAGPKDFYHPASVEPQPTIWLPRDSFGFGEGEERANRAAGIKVSTQDATMDDKGHVDVSGPPPDLVL